MVLAVDRRLGRQVAIKVLRAEIASPDFLARFEREARVTARLRHPHVVAVYDHGACADGAAFIVYEYVEGQDLGEVTTSARPGVATVLTWCAQVADALAAAHAAGVVHRDVKPGNILLRHEEHAVVCDFGIATLEGGATVHTAEGIVLGTPAFLAPQVLFGERPTEASDQFALGATILEVVHGVSVYPSSRPRDLIDFLLVERPLGVPPEVRGALPGLDEVLDRSLAWDPAARYPDLAAFRDALHGIARDLGSTSGPVRAVGRGAGPRTTRKVPARGAPPRASRVVAAAAIFAALVGAGYFLGETPPAPAPAASPAPAPAPGPEDRFPRLPRIRSLVGHLRRAHVPDGGRGLEGVGKCPANRLEEVRRALFDPLTAGRWEDLLAEVVALGADLPPAAAADRAAEDALAREIWRDVANLGHHLMQDLDLLENQLTRGNEFLHPGALPLAHEAPTVIRVQLLASMWRVLQELPEAVAARFPTARAAISFPFAFDRSPRLEAMIRPLQVLAEGAPGTLGASHAVVAAAELLRHLPTETMRCARNLELTHAFERWVLPRLGRAPELPVGELVLRLLHLEATLYEECPAEYAGAGPEDLRPLLATFEARGLPTSDWWEDSLEAFLRRGRGREFDLGEREQLFHHDAWFLREKSRVLRREDPATRARFAVPASANDLAVARREAEAALARDAARAPSLGGLAELLDAARGLVAARVLRRVAEGGGAVDGRRDLLLRLREHLAARVDVLRADPAQVDALARLLVGNLWRLHPMMTSPTSAEYALLLALATRAPYPPLVWLVERARNSVIDGGAEIEDLLRREIHAGDVEEAAIVAAGPCASVRGALYANYFIGSEVTGARNTLFQMITETSIYPEYLRAALADGVAFFRRCEGEETAEDRDLVRALADDFEAMAARSKAPVVDDTCRDLRRHRLLRSGPEGEEYLRLRRQVRAACEGRGL